MLQNQHDVNSSVKHMGMDIVSKISYHKIQSILTIPLFPKMT